MRRSATEVHAPAEKERPAAPSAPPVFSKQVPPETEQFAFLVGSWRAKAVRHDLANAGAPQTYEGIWRARFVLGGRVLYDEFTRVLASGEAAGGAITARTYAPATGRWEMVTLDAQQPAVLREFSAEWKDGEMKLSGRGELGAFRGRFYDIREDGFRWEGELSQDGSTWVRVLSLEAERQPAGAADFS